MSKLSRREYMQGMLATMAAAAAPAAAKAARTAQPDNDKINSEPGGQTCYCCAVERIDGVIRANLSGARVSGSCVQLDHRRVPAERQTERMLTSP